MTSDYRQLKTQVRLIQLLDSIGWQPTEGRGEQLRGPCPLPACPCQQSQDTTKAQRRCLSVHIGKNVYHCFECGSSGTILDFWQSYRGKTLYEVAAELYHFQKTINTTRI